MNSSINGLQCITGNVCNPPIFLSFIVFLHSPIWNLANYILRSFQLWPHIHLCFQDLLFPKYKPFHNLMVEPKLTAIQKNIHANNGFPFVVVVNSLLKSTNILVVSHGRVDIGLQRVPKMNCKACFKTSKKLMWNKVFFVCQWKSCILKVMHLFLG